MVSLSSVVSAAQGQVSSELADEMVILHLQSGEYYGLDPVGVRVWSLVQQPVSVEQVCDQLVEEYEVEPDECRRDVLALLNALESHGLLDVAPPS